MLKQVVVGFGWILLAIPPASAGVEVLGDIPLPCDAPISDTIDDPLLSDFFSFSVSQNEIVFLTIREDPSADPDLNLRWRLLEETGGPASDCDNFWQGFEADCGPFPESANLRLQIEDADNDATGDYTVYLQRLSAATACDQPAPTSCDVPADGTIENRFDTDFLSFSVSQNEVVFLSIREDPASGPDFDLRWRLLDQAGNPAADCANFWLGFEADCGPFPADANLRLQIQDSDNDATGDYTVYLQRLSAATACDRVPISCGGVVGNTIENPFDNDLFSFCVTAGTIFFFSIQEDSSAGPNFDLRWRLLDQAGNPAADCGNFWLGSETDCGPFPVNTNLHLQVQDSDNDAAGDYVFSIVPLSGECQSCVIFADGFESGDIEAWR